jgi:hypothetical protein
MLPVSGAGASTTNRAVTSAFFLGSIAPAAGAFRADQALIVDDETEPGGGDGASA